MVPQPVSVLNPPPRLLLGAGPSNINPSVLRAMSAPILGHLDPDFIQIMDDVAGMLRQVFGTRDGFTFPLSGTGHAGMEAGVANLLEPGDVVVAASHGFFGERLADVARRYGATVAQVKQEWGRSIDLDAVEAELKRHPRVKVLAVVHAETSTGVLQPLEELADLAHRYGALFLVDAVTSRGGMEVAVEQANVDFAFSATQKCLGAPPGLSPVFLSADARQAIAGRTTPPATWYLDLSLLRGYWEGTARSYHHTAPITMVYGLHEALRSLLEEGLEECYARHRRNGLALRAGLKALGLGLLAPDDVFVPQITTVIIPKGVDDLALRLKLLRDHNIEIGGGIGKLGGVIWRIGLMGENSKPGSVLLFLSALETLLPQWGYEVAAGAGVAAASKALANSQ